MPAKLPPRYPIHPKHPERLCWGCAELCAAHDMKCGNGNERSPHPCELMGDDWADWSPLDTPAPIDTP